MQRPWTARLLAVAVLVIALGAAPAAAKSGKENRLPGEGTWRLRFRTLWVEGDGCGPDLMDVQADDEMETALYIQATDLDSCMRGDPCEYTLNWKCAMFNPDSQWPDSEPADAEMSWDGSGVSLNVGQGFYSAYGGTFTTLEEDYYATSRELSGTELWTWTSTDGVYTCRGEDQIDGRKGFYDCTGEEDDLQEAFDAPTPPAPQGRWRLTTKTIRVSGEGCDKMDMQDGFSTTSSVHITPVATEEGKYDGSLFSIFFRCSTDESLVEWRDDATAVEDGSGNITLRIDRAGIGGTPEQPEEVEDAGWGFGRGKGGWGFGGDDSDSFEETYSVVSLIFCPMIVPGQPPGGWNKTQYYVCAGNEAWTWANMATGEKCSGVDRYEGERGDCKEGMITSAEYEQALEELEEEEWEQYEAEEEAEMAAQQESMSEQERADAEAEVALKKKKKRIDAFQVYDGREHNRKGYAIFNYQSRKHSMLGVLFVGVPLATLVGGVIYGVMRWRRGRAPPGGYGPVGRAMGPL